MHSKPLVIIGSARRESDTKKFVDFIFEKVDHTVVNLFDLRINGYDYSHQYPVSDEYSQVVDQFLSHDTICFATPVYWYSMSSLMKTIFDRFSDLVTYRKVIGRKLKGKFTFLIAVGAESILPEGFEVPFKCTSEYLDMYYQGCIYHCTEKEFSLPQVEDLRRRLLKK
jgi:multimeric flavodoxin WrbA